MIKILTVGKLNQKYLETGITYYEKQIPYKMTTIEVLDEASIEGLEKEKERLLSKIKPTDYVVLLAIKGHMHSSESFARLLDKVLTYEQGDLVFIIGGSYGVHEDIEKRAQEKISFSHMTFPHQLMRLILTEQIYRGFMILKNHPYHK
ncbi:MAG: 23S rRNA (pseudouridine(1915)-N(3))-methyltransferase RlmH [Tenericutes bacterium HGW-Tenericutes-6]|jgi:23S rRNA (pseudouridine1915-N3)-methyltransferase|nr:MAG: 23S rRNA (pseudouridine(1915)-N(3))-methyltransferase RlmH [Tenericutes bacterium HGW-Tenericutes-6]